MEFAKVSCNLLETSSLSPYDNRHFLLKFQKQGSNTIEMRWNLPEPAAASLKELMAIANDPTEAACKWCDRGGLVMSSWIATHVL